MPGSVPNPLWLFRITRIDNIPHILRHGICNKSHPNADPNYVPIGNGEIISFRSEHKVNIRGYGFVGDYVPFYFDPCSIMLYNILTGYTVKKVTPEKIVFLCCTVEALTNCGNRYFFSDGQANTYISEHYSDLKDLDKVDWNVVKSKNFKKTIEDIDRPRRYQAEFLVRHYVPITCVGAIVVYNENSLNFVNSELEKAGLLIRALIKKPFYFNR